MITTAGRCQKNRKSHGREWRSRDGLYAINDLQEEFDENGSEIETVARDCIGENVGYVLKWFDISIDVEEVIRERDW